MCIYCKTDNYRKIYENHIGPIPLELDGRSYDIHHIDGNRGNNNPNNLKAVSIKEHFDIHYVQGDFGACWLIKRKMKLSTEELSDLASKSAQTRIANGTYHMLGGEIQRKNARQKVKNNSHPFQKRTDGSSIGGENNQIRLKNKTHHLLKREDGSSIGGENNQNQIKNGTHPFLKRKDGTSIQTDKVKTGTHHLLGKNNYKYDHTNYTFRNKITSEIVSMTRCDFCKKFNLNVTNVGRMVIGRYKSVKGWMLIS